jgi:hypothetical protein
MDVGERVEHRQWRRHLQRLGRERGRDVLSLPTDANGTGAIQPLAAFTTNPAGSAIVNAIGPIRQLVQPTAPAQRRYLVMMRGTPQPIGSVVQFQTP